MHASRPLNLLADRSGLPARKRVSLAAPSNSSLRALPWREAPPASFLDASGLQDQYCLALLERSLLLLRLRLCRSCLLRLPRQLPFPYVVIGLNRLRSLVANTNSLMRVEFTSSHADVVAMRGPTLVYVPEYRVHFENFSGADARGFAGFLDQFRPGGHS